MKNTIKKITIVGGGAAGWLTAGIIAAEHMSSNPEGLEVCLIESPDVGPIGVGEGTWPSMRDTLRKIGINEKEFFRECDASFKQGSKFVAWTNNNIDSFYYHPFSLPQGYIENNLIPFWQSHKSPISFADAFCTQSHLCEKGRAPKQFATPDFAAVANYGYHLDAGKFAHFLQKHCTQKLGVKHILDHVTAINSTLTGDIASLGTINSGDLSADLFIDCSGFSSLLLGEHFKIPFIPLKHCLFNDSALAVQVPYENINSPIASATISTAQSAGWIWDIGLPSRRGVGYVFSASHISREKAEIALREYIVPAVGKTAAEALSIRHLSFTPGYREKFWHKNCVAVGMAAGFIEPLEASALALVELSASMICDELPATRDIMDITAERFNRRFSYRWERIVDFLKLHYVLTKRQDSDYWIDNCRIETIPERLQELLRLWEYQPPSRYDFVQNDEIFPSASYQYVLYGMGFKTHSRATKKHTASFLAVQNHFAENEKLIVKYMSGLPDNRTLINQIVDFPTIIDTNATNQF